MERKREVPISNIRKKGMSRGDSPIARCYTSIKRSKILKNSSSNKQKKYFLSKLYMNSQYLSSFSLIFITYSYTNII